MKTVNSIETISNKQNLFLTTYDNTFDPFKSFSAWWKEDLRLGHDCCGVLAREANISDIASDAVNDEIVINAMKELVKRDPVLYRIVSES